MLPAARPKASQAALPREGSAVDLAVVSGKKWFLCVPKWKKETKMKQNANKINKGMCLGLFRGSKPRFTTLTVSCLQCNCNTNIFGSSWEVKAVLNPRASADASLLQKQFDHLVIVSAHSNCQRCQTLEQPCLAAWELHQETYCCLMNWHSP